jgi:hypothetical protein
VATGRQVDPSRYAETLWVMNFLTGSKFRRVAYNGDNHNPAWQPLPH